jgi:DNA sulfur modification protein DndB
MIREDGKVMNSEEAITLTCAKIKQLIGVPLSKDELAKESQR